MGNLCGSRRLFLALATLAAFALPAVAAGGCGDRAPVGPAGSGGSSQPTDNPAGSGGSSVVTGPTGAFTLDLAGAETWTGIASPPVISHNAAIVFPIDVSERRRVITFMWPGTAIEAQTKSTCTSSRTAEDVSWNVQGVETSLGQIPALGGRHVTSVSLRMPYRIPSDDYTRIANGLCVLVRLSGSRDFILVPGRTMATRDDAAEISSAVLPVDQSDVDAIAVLSEETTAVSEITVTLR